MRKLVLLFVFCFSMRVPFAQEAKLMLPIGHASVVQYAEFSPDGKRIVTASADRTAKIWDAENYTLLADLRGHENQVQSARFSQDGKKIVTAAFDGTAKIWDAMSGALLANLEMKGVLGFVSDARFSPDSKKIVALLDGRTAIVWDAVTGKKLGELKGHTGVLTSIEFSPNSKLVVTASNDSTAKIWNVDTRRVLVSLKGHKGFVNDASFSPDGKEIVTASEDRTARIWDVETGKIFADLIGHNRYVSLAQFSPDGKKILTASGDNTVKIWSVDTGRPLVNLLGGDDSIGYAQFSPNCKKIITTSKRDGFAKIWDASTGQLLVDINMRTNNIGSKYSDPIGVLCAKFSSNSKKVIITSFNYGEKVFDAVTGTLLFDFATRDQALRVTDIMFSPDGKQILTVSEDKSCKLWDSETGLLLFSLNGHKKKINWAQFSNDGEKIVTVSNDQTAKIWDAKIGKLLFNLNGHAEGVYNADFSPDGKKVVTSSEDSTAKIWDTETGMLLIDLKEHNHYVGNAQFSADGKRIVTVFDSSARTWDAQNGSKIIDLKGSMNAFTLVFFSPDGTKVISYYPFVDKAAKMWDAGTGAFLSNINVHSGDDLIFGNFSSDKIGRIRTSPIVDLPRRYTDSIGKLWNIESGDLLVNLTANIADIAGRFSFDGKKILSMGTVDSAKTFGIGSPKIWNAQTGRLIAELNEKHNYLTDAGFFLDGRRVITSSKDNTCKVWNAETGRLLYTFFAIDSADYLVTDPDGRYDGTEVARKLLYFTCGTDVIGLDQVKDQLWVPNLVERINKGDSINAKKLSDLDICGLIPQVEREEKNGYHFIITPQRGGLGETVLSVNGIEVKRYKPAQLVQTVGGFELNIPEEELKPYFIAGQQNPVTVKAYTAKNDIASRMAQAMRDETAKKADIPNLYAVMIGVSDYKSPELQLKYAAKDAQDISKAVASSARKLLNTDGKEHVYMYNLTTGKDHYQLPEKIAIKNIFTEIGKKATANDILLIFFAGHGISSGEQKQFYFLTADASQATATDAPAEVGISTKELSEWMKPTIIKAQKRILILDACNSGQAINEMVKIGNTGQNYVAARNDDKSEQIKAIDKLNERSGLFILAASASNQNAYEMGRYSQGLLTYALLKAIKQEPDILEDNKYLNVSRWFNAAEKTVSDIVRQTGNRQEPQIVTTTNFNIGVVDQEVMAGIKLADEKPLFTASNLQNNDPDIAADDLHLNSLLDMQLNEIAARGDDNAITYIPGSASPDAYSLGGRYEVKGDDLTVKVNIRQNDATKYKFELTGKKSDLKALAEQVVTQATDWIVKHK